MWPENPCAAVIFTRHEALISIGYENHVNTRVTFSPDMLAFMFAHCFITRSFINCFKRP
jgi:hypothetical protein